jgi:hypothetical protein
MRFASFVFLIGAATIASAETSLDKAVGLGAAVEANHESPIATDRPGFMDSPSTVPVGVAQVEIGSTFSSAQDSGALSLGGHLLRVGLTKRIELRVSQDGFLRPTSGADTSGWSGGMVGAKVKIADERRWLPNLALVPSLSLAYGEACCASKTYSPTLKLSWTKSAPAGFGLGGNFNVSSLRDDAGRYGQHAASVSVDHMVGQFSAFVETYAYDRFERDGRMQAYFDGGVSRRVGGDLQVDVSVGHSISSMRPEWFVAVGVSMRRSMGTMFPWR